MREIAVVLLVIVCAKFAASCLIEIRHSIASEYAAKLLQDVKDDAHLDDATALKALGPS